MGAHEHATLGPVLPRLHMRRGRQWRQPALVSIRLLPGRCNHCARIPRLTPAHTCQAWAASTDSQPTQSSGIQQTYPLPVIGPCSSLTPGIAASGSLHPLILHTALPPSNVCTHKNPLLAFFYHCLSRIPRQLSSNNRPPPPQVQRSQLVPVKASGTDRGLAQQLLSLVLHALIHHTGCTFDGSIVSSQLPPYFSSIFILSRSEMRGGSGCCPPPPPAQGPPVCVTPPGGSRGAGGG